MRKLRIIGVNAESSQVECEDRDSGEKYSLPLDDRLRAAARGEFLADTGAGRPPVTGTLRPREIQDRIRHGASPEQVASDAGVPLSRIEGFAVPVLLERSNAADMARGAHPVMPDGPSLDTLDDKVHAALDTWGIDLDLVKWDAWRERGSGWILRISWPAGLSDDAHATWSFTPDSHGGSARPLNEEAERILDPSRATALRTVASQPEPPASPPPIRSVPAPTPISADRAERPDHSTPGSPAAVPPAPASQSPSAPAGIPAPVPPAAITQPGSVADDRRADGGRTDQGPDPRRSGQHRADQGRSDQGSDPRPGRRSSGLPAALGGIDGALPSYAGTSGGRAGDQVRDGVRDSIRDKAPGTQSGKTADAKNTDADDDFLQPTPNEPERKPSSRRHPTMPSWEDVLLGVRSKDD